MYGASSTHTVEPFQGFLNSKIIWLIDLVEFLKHHPPSSGYHCVLMHLDLAGQNRAIMWSGSLCNSRIFLIGFDQFKFKTLPGSQTWALRNGGQQYQSANARSSEIRPGFSSGNTSSTHWCRRRWLKQFNHSRDKSSNGTWVNGHKVFHSSLVFRLPSSTSSPLCSRWARIRCGP